MTNIFLYHLTKFKERKYQMNNQMNIMITNISLTRFSNIKKSQYELDDKEGSELQTDGFVTSEAPIKLLIKKLLN